jgi:hypothetical protein
MGFILYYPQFALSLRAFFKSLRIYILIVANHDIQKNHGGRGRFFCKT